MMKFLFIISCTSISFSNTISDFAPIDSGYNWQYKKSGIGGDRIISIKTTSKKIINDSIIFKVVQIDSGAINAVHPDSIRISIYNIIQIRDSITIDSILGTYYYEPSIFFRSKTYPDSILTPCNYGQTEKYLCNIIDSSTSSSLNSYISKIIVYTYLQNVGLYLYRHQETQIKPYFFGEETITLVEFNSTKIAILPTKNKVTTHTKDDIHCKLNNNKYNLLGQKINTVRTFRIQTTRFGTVIITR